MLGNDQAEATRIALSVAAASTVETVRIPPVQELTPHDLPHLDRVLGRVDTLVVQPIRHGYHGLPLGTDEVVSRISPTARHVVVPNVFWTGLYPYQVLVHGQGIADPPIVPYHDVRVLVHVAGGAAPARARRVALQEVATDSLAELQRRERRAGSVVISDVVATSGSGAGHTVDHPGNLVLVELAARVLDVLGLDPEAAQPGHELMRSVLSPLHAEVLQALGVDGAEREEWAVDGVEVSAAEIDQAHRAWYAAHPQAVAAGCARHAGLIRRLGLAA